jgi:hypothetical protein
MKSYLITVTCTDKVFKLIVKSVSKRQATKDAEPTVQNEITTRIMSRKVEVLA